MLVIVVVVLALLAAYFPYTRRISAEGIVTPDGGVVTIRPPESGVITAVHVREGQAVLSGQRLYTLSLGGASANRIRAADSAAVSAEKRLQSIHSELDSTNSASERAANQNQLASFGREREMLAAEHQIDMGRIERQTETVDRLRSAEQSGAVSKLYLLAQQDALSEMQMQALQIEQRIDQSRRQADALKAAIATSDRDNKRHADELEREALLLEESIATEKAKRNFDVTATRNGIVSQSIAVAGQTVTPEDTLCFVASQSNRWFALLHIQQRLADKVRAGQHVVIRDPTAPITSRITHSGVVESVSRIAAQSPSNYDEASPSAPSFLVTVRILDPANLHPGLMVEGRIESEKRSLLSWLFQPLLSAHQKKKG
jgi:membrane fusion protein